MSTPSVVVTGDASDHVAWCRYTNTTIVTCDSDAEGAFRVYRRSDGSTFAKFNQMSDCLDEIRKVLDGRYYASRLNQLEAIRNLISFSLPDTPHVIPRPSTGHDACERRCGICGGLVHFDGTAPTPGMWGGK